MPSPATVYRLLVASPGDVKAERKAVVEAVNEWNRWHGAERRAVFLPSLWETDVAPAMGERPQEIVNRQIVEDADLLVGIFWTRLGTPAGGNESGTVEEIRKVWERRGGENVLLYFSSKALSPEKLDSAEYARLKAFKQECRGKGIVQDFRSPAQIKGMIDRHLSSRAQELVGRAEDVWVDDDGAVVRRANMEAAVDQIAGDRLLDRDLARRALLQKACLSLAHVGPLAYRGDRVEITVAFRNEGQHPAYDVVPSMEAAGGPFAATGGRIGELTPGQRRGFSFSFPRPGHGAPSWDRPWTVRLRAEFRDGTGGDAAEFVLRLTPQGAEWGVEEDRDAAVLSSYCRHLRPRPAATDRRPANLTSAEHGILGALLARYVENPVAFRPTLLHAPIGDDSYLYSLDTSDAPSGPRAGASATHHRDFIPTLVQQRFLVETSPTTSMIADTLLRAYGLEPPSS